MRLRLPRSCASLWWTRAKWDSPLDDIERDLEQLRASRPAFDYQQYADPTRRQLAITAAAAGVCMGAGFALGRLL